jgi:hypothetical protein
MGTSQIKTEVKSMPRQIALHRPSSHSIRALFVTVLVSCLASAAFPERAGAGKGSDVAIFVNGDRVTGKLTSATTVSVLFEGNTTGPLTLKWTDLDHIAVTGTLQVSSAKSAVTQFGGNLRMGGSGLVLKDDRGQETFSAGLTAAPPPLPQPELPSPKALLHNWGGTLSSQNNLVRATQKKADLGATLHSGRDSTPTTKRWYGYENTQFDLQANYSDSVKPGGSPVITSLYKGQIEQAFNIGASPVYVYGHAEAYHNSSLGLDVEQGYGAGVGWDGSTGGHSYGVSGDVRYWKEDVHAPGASFLSTAFGLTEYYTYKFPWPRNSQPIAFTEKILLLPIYDHANALQSRAFAQIDIPLNTRFSFGVMEQDDYARNAPHNSKQNYSSTQFTLKYSFGRKLTK